TDIVRIDLNSSSLLNGAEHGIDAVRDHVTTAVLVAGQQEVIIMLHHLQALVQQRKALNGNIASRMSVLGFGKVHGQGLGIHDLEMLLLEITDLSSAACSSADELHD